MSTMVVRTPLTRSVIESIDAVIDRTIAKAAGRPALQARGEVLRARMHATGFRMPTTLTAVGRVPPGGA